jgi:RNA polymerase sigma-70 factor (ECF subfamily)
VTTGPIPPDARRARFEGLVGDVLVPLQRYLRRRAGATVADDVLADTLLVLWRRLDDVPADTELMWCYGVARRCLANHQRASRRQLRLVGRLAGRATTEPRVAPAADAAHHGDPELEAALGALSADDRELLQLWAWERLEPGEIAEVLGVTPNAVSIRLHRAKRRLRLAAASSSAGGKDLPTAGHSPVGLAEEH